MSEEQKPTATFVIKGWATIADVVRDAVEDPEFMARVQHDLHERMNQSIFSGYQTKPYVPGTGTYNWRKWEAQRKIAALKKTRTHSHKANRNQ